MTDDFTAIFGSPEDVILKKMEYYRLGVSEKHLRDIAGVLLISSSIIDRGYIETWAGRMELSDIARAILNGRKP